MDDRATMEWMQEVYKEFQNTNDKIDESRKELKEEIGKNREEFVIFKTKITTRTALIATIISASFAIFALLVSSGVIRVNNDRGIEITKPINYELGIHTDRRG